MHTRVDNEGAARLRPVGEAARALRAAAVDAATPDRSRILLWAPVCFGLGVYAFFSVNAEPSAWAVAFALAVVVLALPASIRARGAAAAFLLSAAALAAGGFAAASLRAQTAAAPVLSAPLDATVEGRVAALSRSRADQLRAELRDVVVYGLPKAETPVRVRLALLQGDFERPVRVGDRIAVYARLSPPGSPVEPGGFDFRRHAWFEELGGVGYARGPAMLSERRPPPGMGEKFSAAIAELRDRIAAGILEALPGERGAFAAAIIVGSRAEIGREPLQALRDSNLAHLLAISGLHMGLLAGIVFGGVRGALALWPGAAQRFSTRKAAACAALVAATAYLALSGASVATQRAWVMAAAALIAILLDRPAISLRALAAAALLILIWRPESLLNAGFQMSFAAALALVAAWESPWGRTARRAWEEGGRGSAVARWVLALALTSAVAGLATAPFSAMSFNRLSQFGLIANMLAVPAMGLVAMPAAAVAGLLAPLGLHELPLTVMGWAIDWILNIARWAASLPGAVRAVSDPPVWAPPMIIFGGLALCLLRGPLRLAGLAPLAAGVAIWIAGAPRPTLLIAPGGAAIGLMGPEGRAVDRARGAGYAVESWLSADGDGAEQAVAAARPGLLRQGRRVEGKMGEGWKVVRFSGRARPETMARDCMERVLLIAPAAPEAPPGRCVWLGPERLAALGALSVETAGDMLVLRSALAETAGRMWTQRQQAPDWTQEDDPALASMLSAPFR